MPSVYRSAGEMATKCDIIRDFAAATRCGLCCSGQGCPPSAGCGAIPAAACRVGATANARMALFAARANPVTAVTDRAGRAAAISVLESQIADGESAIRAAYPEAGDGAKIGWGDFDRCLKNREEIGYFGRTDAIGLGMAPVYPLGGQLAKGLVWRPGATDPVPLYVDNVANPDLAAILIFALCVLIFAALLYAAYRAARWAPYKADLLKEAESERPGAPRDPQEKCRAYVIEMEKAGYEMESYRRMCGLPLRPS